MSEHRQITIDTREPIEVKKGKSISDTEARVYKAIRDQFRPLSYSDMLEIPRLRAIKSFDRYVRKLYRKKWLNRIPPEGGDNPLWEAVY